MNGTDSNVEHHSFLSNSELDAIIEADEAKRVDRVMTNLFIVMTIALASLALVLVWVATGNGGG